ncbi:PadR family transcriptional regulator [Bacillus mobilis]|uniref:PadR family transcriptional regulator n=1 Tax=Bacillus TaxID=1386 RepID=UPI0021D3331B|nr:PadR family transcriptional regulator [Bacillus mobilis]MCU5196701.1 PadR family transcriptional regulator [Bacillus mobilis]
MRLMILGLLTKRESLSGYEIQQALHMVQSSKWAEVFPASIYHALKKMTNEELIQVKAIEMTGRRSKTIYCITEKGSQEFKRLLKESFQKSSVVFPKHLYTALTFLSEEEGMREEILEALDEQKREILATYEEMREGERLKEHAPEYVKLIFENMYEQCEMQLRFIHKLEKLLGK